MTIDEMKERKRELGLSNKEISSRSGVPVGTLQKIFAGKTTAPRHETVSALEKVLAPPKVTYTVKPEFFYVKEEAPAYVLPDKKPGEYTLDDYYAIPDERRVELIDGVIYDMAAPSAIHQQILGQLHLQFQACADRQGGHCDVFLAPCDVQLDMDNKTMLQPDLFVMCHDYDRTSPSIMGAPDLTVEILSPSTRSKDMAIKLSKYYFAGVKEYWIIDPNNKQVFVYDFSEKDFKPEVFPFDSTIPIHLSQGSCCIDFSLISKKIAPFYS